jgi:hypothetical protein
MSDQLYIKYHKWQKQDYQKLFHSCLELLNLKSLQFYMPIFSLYFYIHNTPKSHKVIDLERKYYLSEIHEITKQRYYNSNMFLKASIYDSGKNITNQKEIFCKTIPILDPMHCLNNNYNLVHKNNYHLPSSYNYNTFHKINDMNNTAYVDVFCSYLFSQLTQSKKNPSFPIFYGSINGIGDYKFDITEEYHDLRIDKCFNDNLGKAFTMDMYISDSDDEDTSTGGSEDEQDDKSNKSNKSNESNESNESNKSNKSNESNKSNKSNKSNEEKESSGDESSSSDEDYNDDYIAQINKIPLQLLFIEKLEGTLEDILMEKDFNENLLMSCIFQVSFALSYLQKRYEFTHNDLHINNIMYKSTEIKFLYYKLNNTYFRVPTYGKIFKIIDFGRAIFTFKKKIFMNDVFSRHSEAGGQYNYPEQVHFLKETKETNLKSNPNYHFDLCRLSMTILEELQINKIENKNILEFLKKLCIDRNGKNFCDMNDDFSLYICIANDACHSLPRDVLTNKLFKKYRIPKKQFPRKSYYSL